MADIPTATPPPGDILIVEDDENLRLALQDNLEAEGYRTTAAATGEEALAAVDGRRFELLILDIMLPGIDGYSLCEKLRAAGVDAAILMLTARTLEDDLVRGFEAGADDYLPKPYRLRELLARVRALLRRRAARPAGTLAFSGFTVDLTARTVHDAAGNPLELTRTEFDLLSLLLRRQGQALSRNDILDEVWGRDLIVDPRTVDNFISSLKKKLRWTRRSTFRIDTVRGVGYRLEMP
ncbi:MAG: response regulator transcription factor [bacterium]